MTSLKERAEQAGNRYDELKGFAADQEINTGGLSIKSHVKFKKPKNLVVEYDQYRNPFEDFEIQVSGGPEFSGDDLSEARLVYDGRFTWIHLINKDVVYKKEGKRLGSPFTGVDVFGQLGFLPDLVSDFLLKDEGEGEVNGRPVDRFGIKPKESRRSLFLKDEVFNLDRAELAIDKEIGLPLKITYYPGQEEQIRFPASQGGPVYVEYSNYEVDELGGQDFEFDPSGIDKVFTEDLVGQEEFSEKFPLSISLAGLEDRGYELAQDEISVNLDGNGDKGFSSLVFVKSDGEEGRATASIQLLAGNYFSREMSRHRSFVAENGEQLQGKGLKGKIVNRGEKVKDRLPEELEREIFEIGWQEEGGFYYLLGQGVEREELISLAVNIVE